VLSVAEAVELILRDVRRLPVERVPVLDALGRVLARPLVAPLTIPPWDNSAMDGYAVRAADVEAASAERPVVLPVTETVAAGRFATRPLAPGTATRIMTGAPLPEGTDTVVRVEDTDGGLNRVEVRNARDARKNVRFRGEDMHEGDPVIPAGTPLGPAQLGVLASCGAAVVEVYRRPRVALLGSGDELVDLDRFHEALAGRKIVSSNSYTLHALVRTAGAEPVNLGVAADDPASLRERLVSAAGCDLIVTSAGVSVGEFDYTRDVLAELGAEMKFWKVRMRPGAPIGFGILNRSPERDGLSRGTPPECDSLSRGIPWIGLPGNPVSTMVTFELFVRPALRRMLGHERLHRRPVRVVLEEPVTIGVRLTHFLRAVVTTRPDGTLTARLTGPQGSGILTSMSLANALLVVPEDRPRIEAGETASALLLTEDAHLASHFAL
jgi:molybdopterin molybdotransferase